MGFGNSQGEPAAKKGRSESDRSSCIPVTLKILQEAVGKKDENPGSELQVHGMEPGMLIVVGTIESLTRQNMSLEFSLNDGTGRMKARYFTSDAQPTDLGNIKEGSYVSVAGNVRTAPSLHFAVTFMRLVDSADEVSHHMIEAAHASLKAKERPPTASSQDIMKAPTPMHTSQPSQEATKVALSGMALQAAVLDFIKREAEGKEEGIAGVAVIQHLNPTPAAEVVSMLQKLVDDGELFNTTDEEHFNIL